LKQAFLGIDPGKSGGISIIYSKTKYNAYKCPEDVYQMASLIKEIKNNCTIKSYTIRCFIENVHAFPTDARSRAFAFGKNFGMWLGILASYSVKPLLVSPSKWQNHFGPFPKLKKDRKNKIKEIAKDAFPNIKMTLYVSDAMLISLYGKEEVFGLK
jgi:hypothetical protein